MYVIARTCRALEFTVLRRYRRSAIKQIVCTLTIAAPRFVLTIHIPYPLRGNYTFLINSGSGAREVRGTGVPTSGPELSWRRSLSDPHGQKQLTFGTIVVNNGE